MPIHIKLFKLINSNTLISSPQYHHAIIKLTVNFSSANIIMYGLTRLIESDSGLI